MRTLLLLALGGAGGTFARYGVNQWLRDTGAPLPLNTLLVNLLGSAALGFVLKWSALATPEAGPVRAGLAIGFCGAFTTMSTFAVELLALGERRQWSWAALYLLLTVAGCLLAVAGGYLAANRLR